MRPGLHLRTTPVKSLVGSGSTLTGVDKTLGPDTERLDGVVIDTPGAGFIRHGFAFRLPGDAHVYGYCEGDEIATTGLHRAGPRENLPPGSARLADMLRTTSDAALGVWAYCEQIDDLAALESRHRSGRACTKTPR